MASDPLQDMQALVNILKRERLILRRISLVFMGAAINILFIGFTAWVFVHSAMDVPIVVIPQQNQQQGGGVTATQVAFYFTYVILGIAYSVGASIAFKPKRIVSALASQMITTTFLAVIIATPLILWSQYINNADLARNTFSTIFVAFILLTPVGMIQREIVRRIVGLNGGLEDVDKRVYKLTKNYEDAKRAMLDDGFLSLCDFRRVRTKARNRLVLQSAGRDTRKITLVLTSHDSNSDESILAAFGYQELYDTIVKTKAASSLLDAVLSVLQNAFEKPEMHEDLTRSRAYVTAIRVSLNATKPKISGIVYLPRWQVSTLIATATIAALVIVGYWQTWLDLGAFITTMILIAIEMLFVFLPHVIESARMSSDDED